ncbi:MAG: hypothetical protein AB8I08_10375 [Sandaracinaceae bacterium]
MTHATRVLLLISGLALGLGACTSRVQVVHRTPTPAPSEPAPSEPAPEPTPTPTTGVPVEIAIASATLGGDCPPPPTAAQPVAADIAEDMPSAGAPAMRSSTAHGRFAPGYCDRTGLQLAVTAPEHHPGGALEVLEVRLLTMEGAPAGTLEVRGQTLFEDGAYVAWDGNVRAGQQNISVHTSGPDWAAIGGDRQGFGLSYRIEVDLRVGGETRTLEMAPVSREPMVVT